MSDPEPRYAGGDPNYFRISNSSIETFLRCGLLYWFRRESKERFATVPMVIGTAVSKAAEHDNTYKLAGVENDEEPSLGELVEVSVEAYDEELGQSNVEASRVEVDSGRDAAASAARAYGLEISPKVAEVLMAEKKLIARFPSLKLELAGTPDAILVGGTIRDVKTGQPWNQRRADRSRQLTGYDILLEAHLGAPAERVAIDTVHRDRRGGWTAETLWSKRTARDRAAFLFIAQRVQGAILRGDPLPAPEGAWWCAPNWCPFWNQCTARPGA